MLARAMRHCMIRAQTKKQFRLKMQFPVGIQKLLLVIVLLGHGEFSIFGAAVLRPIALRDYCNFSLTNSLIGAGPLNGANNLASLPKGTNAFANIPFDVSGVIQLNSQQAIIARRAFPDKVSGIKIGATCSLIHILHGAGWNEVPATKIATLLLKFEDGETKEIPIIYGQHVYDWWENDEAPADKQTAVAWTGVNPISKLFGASLRLYKTSFANPKPGAVIESVDFISLKKESAPFLLGLTLE
jgi:hypothetical protein